MISTVTIFSSILITFHCKTYLNLPIETLMWWYFAITKLLVLNSISRPRAASPVQNEHA